MNITVQQGEIQNKEDEAIVVNLFEGTRPGGASKAVDQALDGLIDEALNCGDFKGAKNDTLLLYTQSRIPARRVLVVGLGKQKNFDLEAARQAAGTAARTLQNLGIKRASSILQGTGAGNLPVEDVAQAMAEASMLACYRFDHYHTGKKKTTELWKKERS